MDTNTVSKKPCIPAGGDCFAPVTDHVADLAHQPADHETAHNSVSTDEMRLREEISRHAADRVHLFQECGAQLGMVDVLFPWNARGHTMYAWQGIIRSLLDEVRHVISSFTHL